MLKLKIRGIAAAMLAGAMLAGCSGGGSKSVLPSSPSSTVSTSVTITIGGAGTKSAVRNGQTIPATASKSIVIRYIGDTTPQNPPTNAFTIPSAAQAATIGTNTYWNLTGCTVVGALETCTVPGVVLPIGTIDIYVSDYDNINGTGNLIYGSVTTAIVTAAGAIDSPATGNALALTALGGNVAASGASIALSNVPTAISFGASTLVAPQTAATSYTYPATPGIQVTATDANGLAITGTISPIVVTDTDTSGNTCLILVKGGGAVGTNTCTATAGSTSSVTTSSTLDSIYLKYNNSPMSVAGFSITAAPATGTTPATQTYAVAFQPAAFLGLTQANNGTITSVGGVVYVGTGTGTTAAAEILPFTQSHGKLTAGTALPGTNLNGATNAGSYVTAMTAGPDGNLYFADDQSGHNLIGVYAVATAAGTSGATPIAKTTVAETGDFEASLTAGSTIKGLASYGGYIWAVYSSGDLVRIDPNNIQSGNATAGLVIVQAGTNNNTPPAPPEGGLIGVAGVGLFYPTVNGGIVKIATPSVAVNAAAANLIPSATSITESPANGNLATGIILGTDGNLWTANASGAAGPFLYAPQSVASLGTAAVPAGSTTYGGIAQGGPDSYIYTIDSTNVLDWTNTAGTKNGTVTDGSGGKCINAALVGTTGEQILAIGGGLFYTSQGAYVCAAIP